MKKKRSRFSGLLLILLFFAGLSLLLYPSVANYINELHGSKAISDYSASVAKLSSAEYDEIWRKAQEYNKALLRKLGTYTLTEQERTQYNELLNINGSGVMGYIEIPSIGVTLPVYHGTEERVLQVAVGHLDWTSLPVGGLSTHCALSGHRGLPSAKLFTNLDKLIEGDVFMLRVLNEVLTYEVDQVLIVLPENTSALQIEKGKDLCTLVTCTPYGINSHRLLVRGHRIENTEVAAAVHITAEAIQVEPLIVASVLGVPTLILLMIVAFLVGGGGKKNSKRGRKNEK